MNAIRVIAAILVATLVAAGAIRFHVTQRIEARQAENRELELALRSLRGRSQVAKVLAEESTPAAEAFAELSRLPADIVLTDAEAIGMRLVANGVARSDAATHRMIEQLGATRLISNPRIAKIDPAPAHDPFGAEARVFRLEAELRH